MRKKIPLEWSAIIGDAVHNLRSALDHLAWQLVEVSGGTPSRNTMFPIGDSKGYNKYLTQKLDGANAAAQRFVRRLRPHSGGNKTLTQLHALDITDKHKLVLIVGAAHKNFTIMPNMDVPWQEEPLEFPPIAITPADRQFPLQDGAEVFGISASARTEKNESQYGITFELAFGDVTEVQGLPLLETLEDMHRHVEKIVQIADRQFFK